MTAVMMLVQSRLRRRWRAWTALTVLLAVATGVVLTAAAGARRTDSAYPRYLQWANADDLLVSVDDSLEPALARLPMVSSAGLGIGYSLYHLDSQGFIDGDPQRAIGPAGPLTAYDRPHVVAGRDADQTRADEATVNPWLASLWHLHPGSRVTLRSFLHSDEINAGDGSQPVPANVGQDRTFVITGIVAGADDVIADPKREVTRFNLTAAYTRAHSTPDEEEYSGIFVRLRHGSADVPVFVAAVNRLVASQPAPQGPAPNAGTGALFNARSDIAARVQHAVQPEVVALWLFAGLVAATALLIVGQAVSRQLAVEADDAGTLRALGMSPRQLVVASLAQVGLMAVVGALVGCVLAVLASPLMPIGPVSVVEPQPGISVDAVVLGVGAPAAVVLLLLREVLPAWRQARGRRSPLAVDSEAPQGGGQPSRVGAALAQAGAPASAVVGVRMALEPGHGRAAVPVRSTMAGTALAIAAVVAALTFASSLTTLISTPRLYGWNWDLQIDNGFQVLPRAEVSQQLGHDPDVAAVAGGAYGRLHVDGLPVPSIGLVDLLGSVPLTIEEGRSAAGPDEIVLGAATLSQLHRSVGDTVNVAGDKQTRTMRVVGRAVFPALGIGDFAPTSLGVGAAVSVDTLDAVGGTDVPAYVLQQGPGQDLSFALIRWKPGVDGASATARIQAQVPRFPFGPQIARLLTPTDIATYERLQSTPLLLAAILGLLGVGTLAHALISAVRRRARDLAVLKTLGFVRSQVWTAVAWQATTLAAIALVVGVPVGIAAGRWAWSLFAGQVDVVDDATIPLAAVLLAVPAAIILANLLAAIPGRVAGQVRPALVLRSE